MTNYHGYTMNFEWDSAYFMPFLQYYCFIFGWIPIVLAFVLIYLLFYHSPMYSKEFRYSIAFYHAVQIFHDVHHSYLFVEYPLFPMPIFVCHGLLCRWGAPTRLLMAFTGLISSVAALGLSIVAFVRLRNLLPLESRSRLTIWQSVVLMSFVGSLFISNAVGFALFGGDDPRKAHILNRTEFLFLHEKPDSLVWGDFFDTPTFDNELYLLTAVLFGGVIFFSGILVYTLLALRTEKKKLLQMTTIRRTNDQGNRMLMIKLFGQIITFVLPLTLMISSVKVGALSYNPYIISACNTIYSAYAAHTSIVPIWTSGFTNNRNVSVREQFHGCYTSPFDYESKLPKVDSIQAEEMPRLFQAASKRSFNFLNIGCKQHSPNYTLADRTISSRIDPHSPSLYLKPLNFK